MKGVVDDSGRAILPIKILCPKYPTGVQIDAWIDTGFTGDLVLPQMVIDDLQLEITGSIDGLASQLTCGSVGLPLRQALNCRRPGPNNSS
jgi:predicted aspartyl protease